MQVIPAIDLLQGRCVRLFQGDFDQVSTYPQDPLDLITRYRGAGVSRLHLVDLDGARTGEPANAEIIHALATQSGLEVQVGGGIRDPRRARELLDAGVQRVVIGSVAAEAPEQVLGWLDELPADRLVLAFDVRLNDAGVPAVATRGWTRDSGHDLWQLVDRFLDATAGTHPEFLCTDIARDGTLAGPNVELYRQCTERYPGIRFIASGGVSGIADLHALEAAGAAAVVTGKALLDGRLTLEEVRSFSPDA